MSYIGYLFCGFVIFFCTFARLCLIHVVEVRWEKQLMGGCLKYFSKTMDLLGLPVLRLHARTSSLAVLVMLLLVSCFNQRIGTMETFFLISKDIYIFINLSAILIIIASGFNLSLALCASETSWFSLFVIFGSHSLSVFFSYCNSASL